MSDTRAVRQHGYDLGAVEKAPGRNEYYLTIMRDGKPVGRVRIRAPMNPPTYYGDEEPASYGGNGAVSAPDQAHPAAIAATTNIVRP